MNSNNIVIDNKSTQIKRDNIQLQQNNPDKPVLVVKYSKKWIIGWFIFSAFGLFLFGSVALFYTQQPDESYYEYLFTKILSWFFVFTYIYIYIDELNTERFEIYDDRIEKKVKVFKKLPILGDKVVYFDTAYFAHNGFGILICNCRFLLPLRGILFLIMFLPREDVYKVAEILSQKSGRSKSLFASFGVVSFTKKFKKNKNNIWDIF
ncbi:hypothetical protein [Persephonella sp.]